MIGWPAYRSERERIRVATGCGLMTQVGRKDDPRGKEWARQFWPEYEGAWFEMKKKKSGFGP